MAEIQVMHILKEYGNREGMYYQPQRAAAGLDPWTTPQAYDNAKDFFDTGVTWR